MEITFLGVGEACDPRHGNTAILVTGASGRLLLDCGFSVPHRFFAHCDEADGLDGVWISHFHGDHFLGLPLLLLRFWEMGRRRSLVIMAQEPVTAKVEAAMKLAYPGFLERLTYALEYLPVRPEQEIAVAGFHGRTAATLHSQANLGIRLDDGNHRLFYSGDGRPTEASRRCMRNCDLVIHEAFRMQADVENHGSISGCLELLEAENIARLALVHLERRTRLRQKRALGVLLEHHPRLLLPQDDDRITLAPLNKELP